MQTTLKKERLAGALLEIIDAFIYVLEDNREKAAETMKKSLNRLMQSYTQGFGLQGSRLRVRLKARMMLGFMCSSQTTFPLSERLWRVLHNYWLDHNGFEYVGVHPEEKAHLLMQEKACIAEVEDAITNHPIQNCNNYQHLVEAFDMMRHWAHCIFSYTPHFETIRDLDWRKVNPWRLEWWKPEGYDRTVLRGKSLLIDYWWGVPENLRAKGHEVLELLASEEMTSVDDLKQLRKEVEDWRITPLSPNSATLIKNLSSGCLSVLTHYFSIPPPSGAVMLYNNRLSLKELEFHSFTELLGHEKAITVRDKYGNVHKKSIALSIHEAALDFMGEAEEKTVLDVGCKIGHFSFLMAEAGAKVVGVEYMELPTKVAACLARIRELTLKCTFINEYIHKYLVRTTSKFDLTLMLNVFDHCLSNQEIGWKVLKHISCRSAKMVLMMGPTVPAPNKINVPTVILEHSSFRNHEKLLSHSYGDRDLWGFW